MDINGDHEGRQGIVKHILSGIIEDSRWQLHTMNTNSWNQTDTELVLKYRLLTSEGIMEGQVKVTIEQFAPYQIEYKDK